MGGITANSWLNGLISSEMRRLLQSAFERRPYTRTTGRQAAQRSVSTYAFSLFVGFLSLFDGWTQWLPHRINTNRGFVCVPVPYNRQSTLFFLFGLLSALERHSLALLTSVVVALDIWYHGKLPSSGAKRELPVYLFRILVVFLVMWFPTIVVFFSCAR